jgi:methyl-accepting chemotaxis protein
MTIAKKLYIGFASILAILILLFIVNSMAISREHGARADAASALDSSRIIENVKYQMMENRLSLRNYLLSGDSRQAEKLTRGEIELTDLFERSSKKTSSDDLRNTLREVEVIERSWTDNFSGPLVAKRRQVDAGDATVADLQVFYLHQTPGAWVTKSAAMLDEASNEIQKSFDASTASANRASTISSAVGTAGTLLAILLGIGVAFFTARSITRPLDGLIAIAREIGESGDLNQSIALDRTDEIGALAKTFDTMIRYLRELASVSTAVAGGDLSVEIQPRSSKDTLGNAFSQMAHGLRGLVRQVRDSASQVAAGSNQVAQASDESSKMSIQASSAIDEVSSTMHEMSINVQNVVKNTQVQASSVSETSASIDQMVTSIQRVADTAKVLLDICQRSREEVRSGIQTMQKATDGLNRTNNAIQSSADIIQALGRRADDIGKIIEVIDDLAEQTNLLALNAAIEAARAGEHGLGFAVVADEVRKLAEKSTQSTKEISELIQSIQKEAREAVGNMGKSTVLVEEGLNLGKDLHGALGKISDVVSEVYKFAQEIGAATNEQSHGSTQIAKATSRLTEITQEINSSVEEQASGAQAVVRAMEKMRELVQQSTSGSTELAAAAEQMSKLSRHLLESMDRFVLDSINGQGNGKQRPVRDREFEHSPVPASHYAQLARS